jgi:hypothetical protein
LHQYMPFSLEFHSKVFTQAQKARLKVRGEAQTPYGSQ